MVSWQSSRSARPRGRSLLSVDKNYARRIDTLYKKAFEAPGVIADESLRSRCRLAVIQELDGVCSVFLTHNDESWPPSREDLKVSELPGNIVKNARADRLLEVHGAEPATLYRRKSG